MTDFAQDTGTACGRITFPRIPQRILAFPPDPVYTFETLIVGQANRQAVQMVRAALSEQPGPLDQGATGLVLTGEEGTGKTHLLHAAVHQQQKISGARSALYLDTVTLHAQLQESGEQDLSLFLGRHAACHLVAVDDLETLEATPLLQEGVLYLFNQMRRTGGRLLVAGRHTPQRLAGLRDDLRSRLLWGPVMVLDPPEDEMLMAILAKMVEDRQVRCSAELLKFLHLRLPRCIPDYAVALDRLNDAGLGLKRPLTVPLAKEILAL